uniref:Uncharacterized protein n=1 Tax=Tetranychus urticae TaxID=32264 RepID=T1K089_TETUR
MNIILEAKEMMMMLEKNWKKLINDEEIRAYYAKEDPE